MCIFPRVELVDAAPRDTEVTDEIYAKLAQTMVFVNTAEAAQWLATQLDDRGLVCAQFHKLVGGQSKQQQLRAFQSGEVRVLVCTDHAARGLDLPQVEALVVDVMSFIM